MKMKMKAVPVYLSIFYAGVISFTTTADEYSGATLALCEKVKSCALEQMGQQEITPEVRQMMQPMLDNMCSQMAVEVEEVASGHALYKPALACMKSMAALSCADMQSQDGPHTEACKEYEALAEKYSSP